MRRASVIGIIVAAAVAAVGVAAVVRREPAPVVAAPPIPVTVAVVAQGDVPIELDGLGHVQALNTVDVRSQVSGQIEQIAFTEGQTVKVGDLLVQIDPRTFQAKLAEDQAALARDQAHLVNAEANLSRYQPLEKKGFATDQQLDTQTAEVAQLKATIQSDQAIIDKDQVELGYTTITAPIAGVTGFRLVDVGNIIHPSDPTPIVTIAQVQPIAVLFPLTQGDLPALQEAMNKSEKNALAAEAWSQDGTTLLGRGQLLLINNKVDANSGTITLKAEFPNPQKLLWPGEFVQARLILEIRKGGLTAPRDVVQRGPQGVYVWVVNPDGAVSQKTVQVAQEFRGQALIDSGLSAGEQVVANGQYGLYPGALVVVQASSGEASALLKNTQTHTLGIVP